MKENASPAGIANASIPLPIANYRFVFTPKNRRNALDQYPGSDWRGALGAQLRRSVCVTGMDQCRDCPLLHRCAYPYLMETPPPPNARQMRKYQNAPHPFVLRPPERLDDGAYCLELTLIGHAIRHSHLLSECLQRAAEGSRGIAGNRFRLQEVQEIATATPVSYADKPSHSTADDEYRAAQPAPNDIIVQLITPASIKTQGKICGTKDFTAGTLLKNLMRRLSLLCAIHTDAPLAWDFKTLTRLADQLEHQAELGWAARQRYSSRQNRTVASAGVTGWLLIKGLDEPAAAPLWTALWLGQWLHVGRHTTMGMGQYNLIDTA